MTHSERLRIATRYTFPSGRGHLSTFLSSLSMLGLVLAIALLIVVLSVMNGFDKEMRQRILALVPHITLYSQRPMQDWQAELPALEAHPAIREVTPFAEFDVLVMRGSTIETARGVGVDISGGHAPQALLNYLGEEGTTAFRSEEKSLVLGSALVRRLGVSIGDRLTLIVPAQARMDQPQAARFEALTLAAVLDTGTELDQGLALVHLPLAAKLSGGVDGFRIATDQLFEVRRIAWDITQNLGGAYYSTHWMMTHGNLYAAIQLSRNLVSLLLLSIIAVAAFNVVSSLVLVVLDKQGNIAILRTLGASGNDIAWIFLLQGAMIGAVGVALGSLLGAVGSLAVPGVVSWLEGVLDMRFLSTDVYPVSFLPVDLLLADVLLVGAVALVMCVLAAIYPARRAARLSPAVVLSQDH